MSRPLCHRKILLEFLDDIACLVRGDQNKNFHLDCFIDMKVIYCKAQLAVTRAYARVKG